MLSKSYRSLQFDIQFITQFHLRTVHVNPNCLSLFVLLASVISRTGEWQINDVTQFDVSCRSKMTQKISYFLTHSLTPRSTALEILTKFQLVKKYPHFMEPEVSLPQIQVPALSLHWAKSIQSITNIPTPEDPS